MLVCLFAFVLFVCLVVVLFLLLFLILFFKINFVCVPFSLFFLCFSSLFVRLFVCFVWETVTWPIIYISQQSQACTSRLTAAVESELKAA